MSLDEFTNVYPISKTLRFELKPVGQTAEWISKEGFLKHDKKRAEGYPTMKMQLDKAHKALLARALKPNAIQDVLKEALEKKNKAVLKFLAKGLVTEAGEINWEPLKKSMQVLQSVSRVKEKKAKEEAKKVFETEKKAYRELCALFLKADTSYDLLTEATPNNFIKENLNTHVVYKQFNRFATYLSGYQTTRRNIYATDGIPTAAATRLIDNNFVQFCKNCQLFDYIQAHYPAIIEATEASLKTVLGGASLASYFEVASYTERLTQQGIEAFNQVLGGVTPKEGEKIQGLNEQINLYRQQVEGARVDRRLTPGIALYKQILSDRTSPSFIPLMFDSDKSVLEALKMYLDGLHAFPFNQQTVDVIPALFSLVQGLSASEGIYITCDALMEVSKAATNDWRALPDAMAAYAKATFKTAKEANKWLEQKTYTLAELAVVPLIKEDEAGKKTYSILDAWSATRMEKCYTAIMEAEAELRKTLILMETDPTFSLRKQGETVQAVAAIKDYLSAVLELVHVLKPLNAGTNDDRDLNFYSPFDALYQQLCLVVTLYNRVRNYMTQKISDDAKIHVMFDKSTLAGGWDVNKENDNLCLIFEKDGRYYLGIINPKMPSKQRPKFDGAVSAGEPVYQKMYYKYVPGPNKMLPKVFMSAKGKAFYHPSATLLEKYGDGLYKKGDTFDLDFCHELIDFYKSAIARTEDWKVFNFKFKPTEMYASIDQFYRDFERQSYKLTFKPVSVEKVDQAIADGKLLFFQIYNKDFALTSATRQHQGRKNLHTIYWESLFAPSNFENLCVKLNGGAELFYRPAQLQAKVTHPKGSYVVNRRLGEHGTGEAIPENIHKELEEYLNTPDSEPKKALSEEALAYKAQAFSHPTSQDLIKNRRYTEDKFSFHVPITLNCNAVGNVRLDYRVNDYLRAHPETTVIGIDRGERNLIYVTLIDAKGNILFQHSYNFVNDVDYHGKLAQCEDARDLARKSWGTINKIKDLKEGYLSAVVHEITTLMIRHKSIVVMENLNGGFKRGRTKVEKQVYQKFEKMLIDKLNFLMFKPTVTDAQAETEAGLPHDVHTAYQLTSKFESFERLATQCGFLFYVPAAYTSKIDPTTGFTNLFDMKACTNVKGYKAFLSSMTAITYDKALDRFKFVFEYKNFKIRQTLPERVWTVLSAEERWAYIKEKKCVEAIKPTECIKQLLKKEGIELQDHLDLLAIVKARDETRENATFFRELFMAFKLTLQMRNSNSLTGEDSILSPVLNAQGEQFNSSNVQGGDTAPLPRDADANGAYHIALKGLMLLQKIHSTPAEEKLDLSISNEEWFKFTQARND